MGVKCRKVIAPLAVLAMVAVVWYKTGIYFETNDDKCFTEILCGQMTGAPQARTVYVSYLMTLPLSLLYRITTRVPWYGGTLVLLQVVAYTAVLESIYSRCRKTLEMIAGTAFVAVAALMNLYILGCIEFTSTAALLAAAGYFCLLVQADPKRGWHCFCLLEILAGLLRTHSMVMMQPMGFLAVWVMLFVRNKGPLRERLAALGKVILPPVVILLVIAVVNAVVYRGSDWKAYMKFLDAQTVMFDYGGTPPYEEVRDILDQYQASEVDYNAYACYMMLDWVLSAECAEEVAAYAKGQGKVENAGELWGEMTKNLFEDPHWGLNHVLVFLWIAAVILALLWKELPLLLSLFGLLAGKLFTWGFLLYRGRFPLRVSMPLLAGEILLLLALLLSCGTESGFRGNGKYLRYCGLAALLSGLCFVGFRTGRKQYTYVLQENRGQEIFMEGLREIGEYCDEHPENRYILDAVSMSYYRGSALECEVYRDSNYIVSGSWYSNSPYLRRHNAEYLSEGEGFYFLIYDGGEGTDHPAVAYLIQETGKQPEVYGRFTASHGGVYLIYYFDGAYHIEES